MTDIFLDKTNSDNSYAGVFEGDDEVSYFYLYKTNNPPNERVLGAVQVLHGRPDFDADEADIRWFENDKKVGLFIRQKLWAYFDLNSGQGRSGGYPTEPLTWPPQ